MPFFLIKTCCCPLWRHGSWWAAGLLCAGLFGSPLWAQTPAEALRDGNYFFDRGEFGLAEKAFRRGLLNGPPADTAFRLSHNLGNTIARQAEGQGEQLRAGRYGEAASAFEQAARYARDPAQAAGAWFNAGNAWQRRADALPDDAEKRRALEQGIQAYREALRRSPGDPAAQNNLAMAQQKLKKLQPPPPPPPPKPENQPPNQPPPPPPPPSQKPEAQRLLKILESEERATQGKLTKKNAAPPPNGKDW
jgi:tetratricopeptide (TPR) repeat protein